MHETARYIVTSILAVLLIGLLLALGGCGEPLPHPDSTRPPATVDIPIPTPCVRLAEIEAEPAHAHITPDARQAASALAAADLRLRAWGRRMHAQLIACAVN